VPVAVGDAAVVKVGAALAVGDDSWGVALALAVGDAGAVGVFGSVGVGEAVAVTNGRNAAMGPELAATVKPGVGEGRAVTDGTGEGIAPLQALPTARITNIAIN
jgi:hypothetical protein